MKYTLLKNKETGERRIRISGTGEYVSEITEPERYAQLRKKALSNLNRAAKEDCLKSVGLTKVRVNGKTYWE